MSQMLVPGLWRSEREEPEQLLRPSLLRSEMKFKGALRIEPDRAGEMGVDLEGKIKKDDVLEIELEDGYRLWTSYQQYLDDLSEAEAEPGFEPPRGGTCFLYYPTRRSGVEKSRGVVGLAIKGLKIFGIDPIKDVASTSALAIARKLEDRLRPGPGLYSWRGGPLEDKPTPKDLASDKPLLIFLHGTASSTLGSFGELPNAVNKTCWTRLKQVYGTRIFGFEHRTLTESPIENAVQLMNLLPPHCDLHLVSHSRGGLLGELLSFSQSGGGSKDPPFREADLAGFRLARRQGDRGQARRDLETLRELSQLLAERNPRVSRFVRVACPANGTTLASNRLDIYLSAIANIIGLIPGLKENPIYELISDLVLTVAKLRTDPAELPGLEAMMPSSPLIHLLNTSGKTLDSDLSVIAGDSAASGLLGALGVFLTDLYYLSDNDLVVNTSSMNQGAARKGGVREYFTRGPEVNHFKYFKNRDTAERLVAGLERTENELAGFTPVRRLSEVAPRAHGVRGDEKKPVVIIVPGIMGSHLASRGDRIWLDISDLALGKLDRLRIDAQNVNATSLLPNTYAEIVEYLADTHVVIPFPYDWRLSLLNTGKRLGEVVQETLEVSEQPVRILAHSMGGLVARSMMVQTPEAWDSLVQRPSARLIMLGTPNHGSMVVPYSLLGREKLVRLLAMVDLKHSRNEISDIIGKFSGFLEMLPDDETNDFFSVKRWLTIQEILGGGWNPPSESDLISASKTKKLLADTPTHRDRVIYVAGRAKETPERLAIEGEDGNRRIVVYGSNRGDGRVLWETGIPEGVRTWFMDAEHGKLCSCKKAFRAIYDLLETGETSSLSASPKIPRSQAESFVVSDFSRDDEPLLFPGEESMEAAAIGYEPGSEAADEQPEIEVFVTHGDLAGAQGPVMVGHYRGDDIVSAELAIDELLDGRLSTRHRLGLYPGPIGSYEAFLTQQTDHSKPENSNDCQMQGGIVIGLGDVGQLSPGDLALSVKKAALNYALFSSQAGIRPESQLTMSAILVGSGESGIGLRDAVVSVIRGITQANQQIIRDLAPTDSHAHSDDFLLIKRLEFIELYKDRALQALHMIQDLEEHSELVERGARLRVASDLSFCPGGRRRVTFEEAKGWWRRLIIEEKNETLQFTLLGERARSEETKVSIQRSLVDQTIRAAISGAKPDETGIALFELIVANHVKQAAPEQRDLVLVLNEGAARFPWEIMIDRFAQSTTAEPLSVRAGMVRSLRISPEPVNYANGKLALIVGDPSSDLPELPGAQREARQVADELESYQWETLQLIRPGPADSAPGKVITALLNHDFRILHLAGHGVYDPANTLRTGMVIGNIDTHNGSDSSAFPSSSRVNLGDENDESDRGCNNRVLLRPAEVHQMRLCPELVFLNCCHLGRQGESWHLSDRHDLAANLASQFIKKGVKAIIAAGWAVNDRAAATFARAFYSSMLRGRTFGEAVKNARRQARDEYGLSGTWGAYQCYGDPGFKLIVQSPTTIPTTRASDESKRYLDSDEVIVEVHNLTARAKIRTTEAKTKTLQKELDQLWAGVNVRWGHNATIVVAFARGYRQLKAFGPAVNFYDKAFRLDSSRLTITDLEERENSRVRDAQQRARNDKTRYSEAKEIITEEAVKNLKKLLELEETSMRWSLIGSAYKRLVQILPRRQHAGWLRKMTEAYEKATELDPDDLHPALNLLAGVLALGGPWSGPEKEVRKVKVKASRNSAFQKKLRDVEQKAELSATAARYFWQGVQSIDVKIVRSIYENNLDRTEGDILASYRDLVKRVGSESEIDSFTNQLHFYAHVLASTKRSGLVPHLMSLVDSLEQGKK